MIGRMSHWDYLFDEETARKQYDKARSKQDRAEGKAEGRAEGEAKGRAEKEAEIAAKMRADGVPEDIIKKYLS